MSYQRFDFENRKGAVFVAAGCGFKAPKKWGKATVSQATLKENELVRRGATRWVSSIDHWKKLTLPGFDRNYKIDALIVIAVDELQELEKDQIIEDLILASSNIDVQLIAASGGASAILNSQQSLIRDELAEARARQRTETDAQKRRIEELKGLQSQRTKGTG